MENNGKFRLVYKKLLKFRFLILICVTITTYISGLSGSFLSDDIELIQNDPFYSSEKNPLNSFSRSFWQEERKQNLYRPIPVLVYWCEYNLFSNFASPKSHAFQSAFRFVNLFFHITVVILICILMQKLFFSKTIAFATALIFAVHPIHTEAVIPAFGLAEILCATFLITALICHINSHTNKKYVFLSAFFSILAMFSKEHAVIFLPIVILYDLTLKKNQLLTLNNIHYDNNAKYFAFLKTNAPTWSVYALSNGIVFLLHKFFLGCYIPDNHHFQPQIDNPLALVTPSLRVVSALKIQGMAMGKFFFPANLSHDYSYAQIIPSSSMFDSAAILTLFGVIMIPLAAIIFFRKFQNKILFLTLSLIISVIPAGNFLIPTGTIFAERLQYTPSIFISAFSALLFINIAKKFKSNLFIVIFSTLLIALATRTIFRSLDWKNSESLAFSAIQVAPNSVKTWNNIAVVFIQNHQYSKAMTACSKSLEIYPKNLTAYANRALIYIQIGNFSSAKKDLNTILSIEPNNFYAKFLFGYILLHEKNKQQALKYWNNLLKAHPNSTLLINTIKLLKNNRNYKISS